MVLQKQDTEVYFAVGLAQKIRSELVDFNEGMSIVQNCWQEHDRALVKRPGFTFRSRTLLDETSLAAGYRLVPFKDQGACVVDDHKLYAYSSQAARWVPRDRVPEPSSSRTAGIQPVGNFTVSYEAVVCNGYRVVTSGVTNDAGTVTNVYSVVTDLSSGSVVVAPLLIGNSAGASFIQHKLVVVGTRVILLYVDFASLHIIGVYIDLTDATSVALGWQAGPSNLDAAVGATSIDACAISDRFFFAFANAATNNVYVKAYNSSFVQQGATQTIAVGSVPDALAVAVTEGDTLWVAYKGSASANMLVEGRSPTAIGTTVATAANIITGLGGAAVFKMIGLVPTTTGKGFVCFSADSTGGSSSQIISRKFQTTAGACATDGAMWSRFRVAAHSKPFVVDSRVYMAVTLTNLVSADADLRRIVVCDFTGDDTTLRPVAHTAPGILGFNSNSAVGVPHDVVRRSATQWEILVPIRRSGLSDSLDVWTLDFADNRRWRTLPVLDSPILAGGVASYYDGTHVAELGFLAPPEIGTITNAAGGYTGTRSYVAIYEQVDAAGNTHWSEPSAPKSSGAVATKKMTVPVSTLQVTAREDTDDLTSRVRIVLYATTNGGSTYYRVSSQLNDPTVTSLNFTDEASDTTIAANPLLYTHPGTLGTSLPRRAPPAISFFAQHLDGLVGVGDDGYTLWFSGQRVTGEGPWFHPSMTVPIEDRTPIQALASLDGRLYVFTRDSIWVLDGQGYADNGTGGYALPQRLPCEHGCTEPRSVVVTPFGIMFRSRYGLELLDRSGQVAPIGDAVLDTLTSYPVITSATLMATRGLVLFGAAASEGAAADVFLVWDYQNRAWSTWPVYTWDAFSNSVQDACMVGGVFTFLRRDGTVYYESGDYVDPGGAWTTMVVETPWLKMAGLQGFKRLYSLWILLAKATQHRIRVELFFDYSNAVAETHDFTEAMIDALPREALEVRPSRQKVQAVRVRITDLFPTVGAVTTGQGAAVLGVRMRWGAKAKTALGAAHRG